MKFINERRLLIILTVILFIALGYESYRLNSFNGLIIDQSKHHLNRINVNTNLLDQLFQDTLANKELNYRKLNSISRLYLEIGKEFESLQRIYAFKRKNEFEREQQFRALTTESLAINITNSITLLLSRIDNKASVYLDSYKLNEEQLSYFAKLQKLNNQYRMILTKDGDQANQWSDPIQLIYELNKISNENNAILTAGDLLLENYDALLE